MTFTIPPPVLSEQRYEQIKHQLQLNDRTDITQAELLSFIQIVSLSTRLIKGKLYTVH